MRLSGGSALAEADFVDVCEAASAVPVAVLLDERVFEAVVVPL